MAYVTTIWTNDAGEPINATNLNKMEAGIKLGADHAEIPHAPSNAEANLSAAEMGAIISHDSLQNIDGDEHINWIVSTTQNIHEDNYTNTIYAITDGQLSENNLTTALKTNYDTAYSHSQATHAPIDAEPNHSDTVLHSVNNIFSKSQAGTINTTAYASTLFLDLSLSNRFAVTLTGDATVGLPTNIVAGQGGLIYVKQGTLGNRILSWDSIFKFINDVDDDLTPNVVNVYGYEIYDSSNIIVSYLGAF